MSDEMPDLRNSPGEYAMCHELVQHPRTPSFASGGMLASGLAGLFVGTWKGVDAREVFLPLSLPAPYPVTLYPGNGVSMQERRRWHRQRRRARRAERLALERQQPHRVS